MYVQSSYRVLLHRRAAQAGRPLSPAITHTHGAQQRSRSRTHHGTPTARSAAAAACSPGCPRDPSAQPNCMAQGRTPPRRLDVRGDTSGFALCFCAVVAHRRTHAHMHMHTRAHTHLHPFAYRRAPSALSGSWRNALCASSQRPRRARRWGRVAVLSEALAADWPT